MTVALPNATMQPRCQSEIDASVARIVLGDLLVPATAQCPIKQNHGQKFVWVAPVPVRRRRVLVGIQWLEERIDSASSEVPSNRLVKSAFATSFAEVRHFHWATPHPASDVCSACCRVGECDVNPDSPSTGMCFL